jgi:membrane protein implicated in regulation of membrane protease activity
MKRFLALIGYRPSKNDFLMLSWFLLFCGITCAMCGFSLGEPWRGLRQLGMFGFFSIMGLYAHKVRIRREQSRKKISNEGGDAAS